jgi:Cof subfamily protein (haloacid dehalogenase superfamily)
VLVAGFDAVVTDLDGTVIRRDGTVSEATLRAAHALEERGVPLLAATARTPAGLRALHTLLPYVTFAVCCSGAIGYVPMTEQVTWCERISRDAVAALVSLFRHQIPDAGLAAFDGREWRMTTAYQAIRTSGHRGPVSVVNPAELARVDACAMAIGHPSWNATQLIAVLTEAGFDTTRVGLNYAGPRFVEVTAAPVDKASGVVRALRTLGVAPERSIAFGDMPIDVAMFSVVGHSVAMAGSPDEVLASATSQTASVEDDGFARMLAHLGLVTNDRMGQGVCNPRHIGHFLHGLGDTDCGAMGG